MSRESGFVDVEGGRLYYEADGNGFPLVFIHAGIADHTMWDDQFDYFKSNYRVVRYDTRGFGKTTTTQEGISYSNRQDVLDLMQHLGIERAAVVGVSRGGVIATDFTLEFPNKVAALILAGTGLGGFDPYTDGKTPPPEELAMFEEMEKLEAAKDYEKLIPLELKVWVDGFNRPEGEKPALAVYEKVRAMLQSNYAKQEPETEVRTLTPPAVGRLHEIKVPTLVIHGGRDEQYCQLASEALEHGITGARRVFIPDVAHMINLEKPNEFNRLVHEFLKDAHLDG
jgi:3-oxoadipate enol-lactonase